MYMYTVGACMRPVTRTRARLHAFVCFTAGSNVTLGVAHRWHMLAWALPTLFTLTRVPFSDRPHVAAEDLPYAEAAALHGTDSKTMAAVSKQMQKCTKGSLHSEIIAALEHNIGTALVIGANTGDVFTDPAFAALNTSACAHAEKVFVEPIPSLYYKLVENIRHMPHAHAVRAAVTDDSMATILPMFCLFDPEDHTSLRVGGRAKEWWNQICSLDPERLSGEMAHDLHRDLGVKGAADSAKKLVRNVSVPALTVQRLLDTHVHNTVRYVQIDVEGVDDRIIHMLPLGQLLHGGNFHPALVVFEWILLSAERLTLAVKKLNASGYRSCYDGQNVIASSPDVKSSPGSS
jgi:FkbM family methyltransferase